MFMEESIPFRAQTGVFILEAIMIFTTATDCITLPSLFLLPLGHPPLFEASGRVQIGIIRKNQADTDLFMTNSLFQHFSIRNAGLY